MKILATYNIKGGVGKTATAVNLAYLSAREGAPTLVWDLDPQGASTYYFRIKPKIKGGGKKLIRHKLSGLIKGTDYANLDLLPADFTLRNLDLLLDQASKPTQRLGKLLKPLAGDYEYVFLDCPPSLSLLSESIFGAADALLSPIIPTTLSLRALEQLEQFIQRHELRHVKLIPFFSMVDNRKKLHREIIEDLTQRKDAILKTQIPYASAIERMGIERAALAVFAGKSQSAKAYEALWQEVKERLFD